MELQALRYAAMVSTMTFDDVVRALANHIGGEDDQTDEARDQLAKWLDDVGGDEAVVRRDVRIILVSADFGKEIMTTALWLNDLFGTDIRCVRMIPYRVHGRLLLNVEPVIPLPEAEELTVKLRRREAAARVATTSSADWTPYVVTTPNGATSPLRKRWAALAMVHAVHDAGASTSQIADILGSRFVQVPGIVEGDALLEAFTAEYPTQEPLRWFLEEPVHDDEATWIVSKRWGPKTVATLERLVDLVPDAGISFAPG
jgi:hypothetical protein